VTIKATFLSTLTQQLQKSQILLYVK